MKIQRYLLIIYIKRIQLFKTLKVSSLNNCKGIENINIHKKKYLN